MKKFKIIALSLSLIILLLAAAGCAVNPDDVIAMVGETPVYRWYYDAYLKKQLALYEKYNGVDLTRPENAKDFADYKEFRINELIGEAAMKEEARKQGLDKLTPEEEAQINQNYLDYYNQVMNTYLMQFGDDAEGQEKADKAYNEFLASSGLTPERVRISFRDTFIINKLVMSLHGLSDYSDEEVREFYDQRVEKYKAESDKDPAWFGKNVIDPVVYVPEGYIDTMRITLSFTVDQQKKIQTAALAAQKAQQEYSSAVKLYGDTSKEAQKLIPAMENADNEFDKVLSQCYQDRSKDMEEIRQEVLNGADFIKTMEEKSEDTHLISYFITQGSDQVDANYVNAALKLENEGDISEVIRLEQGVCIIRLVEKLKPGVVPFEEVKDELKKSMENTNLLSASIDLQTEFANMANEQGIVTIYRNKLN